MTVIVTDHGRQRIKERIGVSKKISEKVAQNAMENGIKHNDTIGSLKKYIDHLYLSHGTANNIRIFGYKIYLFRESILITVINLPHQYKRAVDKINRRLQNEGNC